MINANNSSSAINTNNSPLAIEPSALFRYTPRLQVFDNLGRQVRSVDYSRANTKEAISTLITHSHYDMLNRRVEQRDPRLFAAWLQNKDTPTSVSSHFSLHRQPLVNKSADAGQHIQLFNSNGQLQRRWDGKKTARRIRYDQLARPTEIKETLSGAEEQCIERFIYQDNDNLPSEAWQRARNNNQIGKLVTHYDGAGMIHYQHFTLRGQPARMQRRFIKKEIEQVHWPDDPAVQEALLTPGSDIPTVLEVAARRPGGETDERRQLRDSANTRSQQRGGFKDEGYTTVRKYNALGELIAQTDAKGHQQRFKYNIIGQLIQTSLILAGGDAVTTVVSDIDYNAWGQLIYEKTANGVETRCQFDPTTGRLLRSYSTRIADKYLLQDLRYQYDPVGNITAIEDKAQSISGLRHHSRFHSNQQLSPIRRYSYDSLYQLTQASGRESQANRYQNSTPPPSIPLTETHQAVNYTRRYRYDSAGNLIHLAHQGAGSFQSARVIAANSNRALLPKVQIDSPMITPELFDTYFDNNGNLMQLQPGRQLHWDGRNQLKKVTLMARNQQVDDEESYHYDSAGQRAIKIHRWQQSQNVIHTKTVHYLPGIELRDNSASQERLQVILVSAGQSQIRLLHWESDPPSEITNDQWRYSLSDQLASSTLECDDNGQLLTREEYYPDGGTALWAAKNQTEAKYKFVRYSGKERDITGLYYYGRRYYAPWLGRWLNPDPAGTIDGLNLYRMARNNPIRYADLLGLAPGDKVIAAVEREYFIRATGVANMTAEKGEKVTNAYEGAHDILQGAIKRLENKDNNREDTMHVKTIFSHFFGDNLTDKQYDKIKGRLSRQFKKISDLNRADSLSSAVEVKAKWVAHPLGDTTIAFVRTGDKTDNKYRMFFNQHFFSQKTTMIDAMSSIIHERSHLSSETEDYFYNAKSNTFLSNHGAINLGSASLTGQVTNVITDWADKIKDQGPYVKDKSEFIAATKAFNQDVPVNSLTEATELFQTNSEFRIYSHLYNAESIALLAVALAPRH